MDGEDPNKFIISRKNAGKKEHHKFRPHSGGVASFPESDSSELPSVIRSPPPLSLNILESTATAILARAQYPSKEEYFQSLMTLDTESLLGEIEEQYACHTSTKATSCQTRHLLNTPPLSPPDFSGLKMLVDAALLREELENMEKTKLEKELCSVNSEMGEALPPEHNKEKSVGDSPSHPSRNNIVVIPVRSPKSAAAIVVISSPKEPGKKVIWYSGDKVTTSTKEPQPIIAACPAPLVPMSVSALDEPQKEAAAPVSSPSLPSPASSSGKAHLLTRSATVPPQRHVLVHSPLSIPTAGTPLVMATSQTSAPSLSAVPDLPSTVLMSFPFGNKVQLKGLH